MAFDFKFSKGLLKKHSRKTKVWRVTIFALLIWNVHLTQLLSNCLFRPILSTSLAQHRF